MVSRIGSIFGICIVIMVGAAVGLPSVVYPIVSLIGICIGYLIGILKEHHELNI